VPGLLRYLAYMRQARSRCLQCCPGVTVGILCFVPGGQPGPLSRLVRAAGCRWLIIEEDFRSGKSCFGLDQSQVRLFTAIARHTALVMAALAICAVTAAQLRRRTDTRAREAYGHWRATMVPPSPTA
jgi:hypothetical protein